MKRTVTTLLLLLLSRRAPRVQQHPRKERIILLMASFVVCNANGLHNTQLFPDKSRRFLEHLRNSSADFAFVSETHFTPTDNPWVLVPNAIFTSYKHKQRGCAFVPLRPGVRFSNVCTDIVDGGSLPPFTFRTSHL